MPTLDDDMHRAMSAFAAAERADAPRFVHVNFGSTVPTGRKAAPPRLPPPDMRPETAPFASTLPSASLAPLKPRPPFLSSSPRPPFTQTSSARRRPAPPEGPDSLGSAQGALLWYTARLEEERRMFDKRLAAAESRHEAAQKEMQKLRLKVGNSPRTLHEEQRQEGAYEKAVAKIGRAGDDKWRSMNELKRERDAALAAAAEAESEAEQRHQESVLLRGEVASLRAAAGARFGRADAAPTPRAASEPLATAAEASGPYTTVGWLAANPAVLEAVAQALMHTLPCGARPHAVKSADDHAVEKALLVQEGNSFDARSGRAALAAALADGQVGARLADALWPAVERLAEEAD